MIKSKKLVNLSDNRDVIGKTEDEVIDYINKAADSLLIKNNSSDKKIVKYLIKKKYLRIPKIDFLLKIRIYLIKISLNIFPIYLKILLNKKIISSLDESLLNKINEIIKYTSKLK